MVRFLLILILLFSCQPSHISPHTKRGQSRIQIKKVQTPYHVQHITIDSAVPLIVKWEGPANKLIIQVDYIIRPTSPPIRFPIYNQNLIGNYYTVYRDLYSVKNTDIFDQDFEDTKIVYLLEFNKIPEQARRYITIRSARVFHDRTLGANTIHKFSSEDEARSLAVMKQAEAATADHTIFDSYLANYTVNR